MRLLPQRAMRVRADVCTFGVAVCVIAGTAIAGYLLNQASVPLFADAAPLFGFWGPHFGPGTPLAITLAVAAIAYGPMLAARLPWGRLLLIGYTASLAWIFSLAMIEGWHTGIATRLTDYTEYLHDVPRVTSISTMLSSFTHHILAGQPDSWTVHVSGHPAGALLFYVWLDRIGLSGGAWAGVVSLLVSAVIAVAIPVTVRAVDSEQAARVALPFVVLFPGAVWAGVSADGMFMGVTAAGIALFAMATRHGAWAAIAGGALLGFGIFLSYGLVLMLLLIGVIVFRTRDYRALCFAAAGAAAVVAAFAAEGFWWLDGYQLVVQRYHQGAFAQRPYSYWVWGNIGAFLLSAGPLALVILRRAVAECHRAAGWLVLAAAVTVLAADLSGLSKAEVERIWLPFAVWFTAGASLLPASRRRQWLAAQALTALVVNHMIVTNW